MPCNNSKPNFNLFMNFLLALGTIAIKDLFNLPKLRLLIILFAILLLFSLLFQKLLND